MTKLTPLKGNTTETISKLNINVEESRRELIKIIIDETPASLGSRAEAVLMDVPYRGLVKIAHRMPCPSFYPGWVQFLQTEMKHYLTD